MLYCFLNSRKLLREDFPKISKDILTSFFKFSSSLFGIRPVFWATHWIIEQGSLSKKVLTTLYQVFSERFDHRLGCYEHSICIQTTTYAQKVILLRQEENGLDLSNTPGGCLQKTLSGACQFYSMYFITLHNPLTQRLYKQCK